MRTLRCMYASRSIHAEASQTSWWMLIQRVTGVVALPCTVVEIRPFSNHVPADRRTLARGTPHICAVSIQGVTGDPHATAGARTPIRVLLEAREQAGIQTSFIRWFAIVMFWTFPRCSVMMLLRTSGRHGQLLLRSHQRPTPNQLVVSRVSGDSSPRLPLFSSQKLCYHVCMCTAHARCILRAAKVLLVKVACTRVQHWTRRAELKELL